MLMETNLRPSGPAALVPTLAAAELICRNLVERRSLLAKHNPDALTVAAAALAEIHEEAHGHAKALRCDLSARLRSMQLVGEKRLGVEDLTAIALESPKGRASVLAGLRVLAQALGHELRPSDPGAEGVHATLARAMESTAGAFASTARALEDGRVDDDEAARVGHAIAAVEATLSQLKGSLARAVSLYRPAARPVAARPVSEVK